MPDAAEDVILQGNEKCEADTPGNATMKISHCCK